MYLLQPNYIVDSKGKIQFAIIPYTQWTELQKKINKVETLEGIRKSIKEVKSQKNKRKNFSTLKDFLNES